MKDKRPVNLALFSIDIPITAVVSFAHRVTGIASVVLAGVALWLLDLSLSSEEGFEAAKRLTQESFGFKLLLFFTLTPFLYHVIAGVRHLLMDMGFFEEFSSGKRSAKVVCYVFFVVLLIAFCAFIW